MQDSHGRNRPSVFVLPKMSGLSETERAGFTKILSLMTKCDLLSLSDTVTNKMIVVENITGKTFIQFHMAKRKSAYLKSLLEPSELHNVLNQEICCIPTKK